MSNSLRRRFRCSIVTGVAAIALMPALAVAQDKPPADSSDQKPGDEIVVTGTLIRNAPPAGAQSIALNPTAIEATGATSTDQVLATIPQNSIAFGSLQTVNSGGVQLTVNRINLRNLPNGGSGSNPTLVLMDGHRIVSMGVKQAFPDPDVIPPELIDRVEVVTDGGSATYGSDAVGGVVNFVTKRNFDGFKVGVRQGFADSYKSTDVNFTAGRSWDTGSVFVSYNFARHDSLLGGARDWVRDINWSNGRPASPFCSPANVTVGNPADPTAGNQTYAVVGGNSLSQSFANLCDDARAKDIYPNEHRHSVMAGFRQELSPSLEFEIKAFYSSRTDTADGGPIQGQAAVTSANPNYIPRFPGDTAAQAVYFNFGPVGGEETVTTKLWSYGITPTLTWKFSHDWEVKAFYNYGQSETTANDPVKNDVALNAAIAAGTINPYNMAASNSAALGEVLNQTSYGRGKDEMSNARVVVDGPLFKLPGGELKIAAGGEYLHEKYQGLTIQDTYQNVAIAPLAPARRNVWSAFAELNIPLVGPDNHVPLVYSFTVAAAERYDHYSDFGGNWAPNVGVTWKPISWVSLRGRWNKSFQAPSLVQISQESQPSVTPFPGILTVFDPLLLKPGVPNPGLLPILAIQGTDSPLLPQKARDYNLGIDISPPFIDGLNLHLTYYNINYSGQIGTPPLGFGQFYNVPGFQNLYIINPTQAEAQTFLANAGVPSSLIAQAIAGALAQGGTAANIAYVVADVRALNIAVTKTDGFDFGFDFHHPVSFGSIDASFNGSLSKTSLTAADGTNYQPDQAGIDGTDFGSVAKIGVNVGDNFSGQLTWNHKAGFTLSVPAQLGQLKVGAFDTFDLFMKYDVTRGGLPPITLSLGINNLFDKGPPIYRGNGNGAFAAGYANGSTIGRLVQLGASVKF